MSAEVFHPSYHCPFCRNTGDRAADRRSLDFHRGQLSLNPSLQPASIGWWQGQLSCPYCKSQLVVSRQGQFVRDPFRAAPRLSIQQLRRQSRPLARLRRDLQPLLWVVAGTLALGLLGSLTYEATRDRFWPNAAPNNWTNNPTATPIESSRNPDRP